MVLFVAGCDKLSSKSNSLDWDTATESVSCFFFLGRLRPSERVVSGRPSSCSGAGTAADDAIATRVSHDGSPSARSIDTHRRLLPKDFRFPVVPGPSLLLWIHDDSQRFSSSASSFCADEDEGKSSARRSGLFVTLDACDEDDDDETVVCSSSL